ncbi:arylsulfatase [Leeuwenhoekiella parthenopeia]|uniref:Arylsulfatase n=1 Tax=Leeuwenhoekiella parthenopeia TaxID=2890320 RepID=A0ABS8GNA6_9FLAO|nr:arylsulfatase [Leeuwenhoekiella parthenopeia]MCC4211256.1 arylsulfatase [Leeuwenhoekiella parthenopeia]
MRTIPKLRIVLMMFLLSNLACKNNSNSNENPKEEVNELPPNIVLIYVDDLGFGDLSSYGQKELKTPNIDKLAEEGMLFTQHYAGSTVCAPSRAALMTGKHTGHTSVRGNSPEGQLLENQETTIAELLKEKGYTSGIIGKWGIGNHPEPDDPSRNGFDHSYGYVNMWHAHNFYPEFLYRNGKKEMLKGNELDESYPYPDDMKEGTGVAKIKETYVLDKFQEDALSFIDKNQKNPFFLYYAINMPHANNEAGYYTGNGMEVPNYGSYKDKDWPEPEKGFAQMIHLIDQKVGEVEAKLKELGLSNNTIVVFASDNGPHNEGGHSVDFFDSNSIYRGAKRDLYEGGIRVPLIVKWPQKIKAGSTTNMPVATWDFLPTFADLTGIPEPVNIDGISFAPLLLGDTKNQQKHEYLYWEFYELGGRQAIRVGDYKLVKLNVRDPDTPVVSELYDIVSDPTESKNIKADFPDKVSELDSLMNVAHQEHRLLSLFSQEQDAETRFE